MTESTETVTVTLPSSRRSENVMRADAGSTNIPSTSTWLAERLLSATLPSIVSRLSVEFAGSNSRGISERTM